MNNVKDLIKAILSRKFAIAAIGIFALCYIATVAPGQLAVDEQAIVSLVPMPKVPVIEEAIDWLKLAVITAITSITCLTVIVQGRLDYYKLRDGKEKIDPAMLEPAKLENSQ